MNSIRKLYVPISMQSVCTAFSRRCLSTFPTSCISLAEASTARGPVCNQYWLVLFASKRASTYLTRHCVHGFNCSLGSLASAALVQPHYLSARIKCAETDDGGDSFSPCCLSFIAMFILQSEMNTVHKKGTVGSGPRAGQAPQVAVSPTHSLSTLHRAHPAAALEN